MTNTDKQMVKVTRRRGNFNFAAPNEEQICITIHLPDDAPHGNLSQTWEPGRAPATTGYSPSMLVDEFEERYQGLISSHKEEAMDTIQWIKENADRIDQLWAQKRIEELDKKIERLEGKKEKMKGYLS